MGARANRWVYGLAALVIAASLAVLYQLQRQFATDLEKNVANLQRIFSDTMLLKTPEDSQIRFSDIEELARKYQGRDNDTFGRMTITKMFGPEERVVYPFYIPARPEEKSEHPLPWAMPQDARKLPLISGKQTLGFLYVRVHDAPLRTVRAVLASLSALLVGAAALFALQFRRQEKVISRTTIALEEKKRELVRLERLALAGQLSANVFHDLKKPVLNIKNELAEQNATSGFVDRVREQIDLFFGIIREINLERFVRAQSEREFVDINEMLERSLALVRYERGHVEIVKNLTPSLPSVLAEPVRLIQVFSNIILNAYQAMDGNGRMTISTSALDGRLRIEIANSGKSIAPEELEKIFQPFYTTKPEGSGTGLGLFISRDIIQDIGGTIRVDGTRQGTTFIIEIPPG